MSRRPISHSADLQRLLAEGYDLRIEAGFLIVRGIPYVDPRRRVRRGMLVSRLDLAGDRTVSPRDHMAWFAGLTPCDTAGQPLRSMVHLTRSEDLAPGLRVDVLLCSRPLGREFVDYHEKVVTFARQLSGPAEALEPTAHATTGRPIVDERGESAFRYADTASSRAGITSLSERLRDHAVAIVGLGGTGSYVLDLVSKTPVRSIHLFDDDDFLQHNVFRSPGAADLDTLRARPSKVGHFAAIYSRLHRGIVPHRKRIVPNMYGFLEGMDFVFVCVDGTRDRAALARHLQSRSVPFVDLGIGLHVGDAGIGGVARVTTSAAGGHQRIWDRDRLPSHAAGADDAYATNVQIADLNALAATLGVIRWKKLCGFYADLEHERFTTYSLDGNHLLNEDPCGAEGSDDA
ncbi:ThiF family adenylyltransferase [Sphingomonas beigongshangi]|uniref:ThiF family adenylyltransferase n=1 Tax=Sphingomonas beigongshangi TaxID=2782540 RepID=UPI001AEEF874|nr:ThiF family adenylyltransferase [Sphingomonas beigongshangi]